MRASRIILSPAPARTRVRSIASTRPDSMKNSAGPPMPNDVRVASGSSWLTPGSARSQSELDLLRQLIAQLLANVARPHQQEQVVRSDQVLENLARVLEAADVRAVGQAVGEVARADARRVLLARGVDVEKQHAVGAVERAREVVDKGGQP